MYSGTAKPVVRSAAWRISLWATIAFAVGTMIVFAFLHRFVADDIQRRSDAWLTGEVDTLGDVAKRTPNDALYGRVVREVAELASREVPDKDRGSAARNDSVFFLVTEKDGTLALWVGDGDGHAFLDGIGKIKIQPAEPSDLQINGFEIPYRVATVRLESGRRLYLGLSERDELRVLRSLRIRFIWLWLLIVLIGAGIVFYSTRRMLGHVREITEAASRIGENDLSSRVPTTLRNDEVAQLANTLNRMLDRIENSMHQLHTITDSLAHDLRSPLTAMRANLEMALTDGARIEDAEPIVAAIEEMDRLTDFLNKSLDVAEAKADALRLNRAPIDVEDLLRSMIDLYEPCMSDKGIRIRLASAGALHVSADAGLLHRVVANLFDNELKHLPAASNVTITLRAREDAALLLLEDNGPGFAPEIASQIFERRVKGRDSKGHGLGLAFVEAVVRAHGGSIEASNRPEGGARLTIALPLAESKREAQELSLSLD